ncbi:phosphoadenylyl-sulfate reductase [Microbaculum marinisediminis]|uniref:Adenosine 5'-phosphosulfate reductase n=1 Tax=Microbaculum marinisediminis TaxID=2931392 RepID=A0AAW5R2C8_9HYPH|nr:phosphoadenylyl-sulfate reductase [Microbaculum sp. A6E488]MCT8973510.1 phosphoadenylyl-sulfate reductase [Microbaculum sp. A6E488]
MKAATVLDIFPSLEQDYGASGSEDLVRAVLSDSRFGRVALVSSFGTEAAVLLHLVAAIDPSLPVLFVDTRKLFGDTLQYQEKLARQLGLTDVRRIGADPACLRRDDPDGMLWSRDPDACCALRKTQPLNEALGGFDTWISGRKRYQSAARGAIPVLELDGQLIKANPLASWTREEIDGYFTRHDLPRHPLEAMGYPSVGCMPCTDRVRPGEDMRAGRWRGRAKTECGIHNSPAGVTAGQMPGR